MDTGNDTLAVECSSCGNTLNITFEDFGTIIKCGKCNEPLDLENVGIGPALEDAGSRMKEMFGKLFDE